MAETKLPPFDLTEGGLVGRVVPRHWRGSQVVWLAAITLTWGCLLGLTLLAGSAFGNAVTRPFLHDLSVMARFLVCLPLFLSAGTQIGHRQGDVITYLWNTDIFTDGGREQYATYVRNLTRWYSPAAVEIILVLLAYGVSWYQVINVAEEGVITWFGDGSATLAGLTAAGWWGALVCQPLWLFLFFRWGWRTAVWWRFLARLSRQDLRLVPTHPDRVGGLGIMTIGQSLFVMLTLGVASILATDLAEDLLAGEMTLRGATPFVVAYVLISTLFIVGPLFSFTALLIRTKRRGVVEYGDLGDELFREFDEKWPPQSGRAQRELLGNSDPSSLADFGYAYEVVSAMRAVPFDRSSLLVVIGITLAPFVPLLLVNYSVSEILQRLLGVLG